MSCEVTVVMPVFNERATVERAIDGVLHAEISDSLELLVVDDGSTDGTRELLRDGDWPESVTTVFHERNRGKGAAIATALQSAGGTWTTIMDADLEYEPADIPQLLAPLRQGRSEVVFGTRSFRSHSAYSFWYVVGNRSVTLFSNLLYNSWLSDIMTGQKAMRTELFRSLPLRERGFAVEAEITALLLKRGARIYEVPIEYTARTRTEGKKLTAMDGVRVVRTLVRCRL